VLHHRQPPGLGVLDLEHPVTRALIHSLTTTLH
jgi:hypothetical protein